MSASAINDLHHEWCLKIVPKLHEPLGVVAMVTLIALSAIYDFKACSQPIRLQKYL